MTDMPVDFSEFKESDDLIRRVLDEEELQELPEEIPLQLER